MKAHNDIKGNEIADRLAKTGSAINPTCEIGQSQAFVKNTINMNMYREWNDRWINEETCRQTFDFYKFIDKGKSYEQLKCYHSQNRTMVNKIDLLNLK